MGEGGSDNRWWHALAFSMAASAGTFIASHWGGVTRDNLDESQRKAKAEIIEQVGKMVTDLKMANAKDNDDLRQFIIVRTTPAAPKVKKRKRSDDE